MTALDAQRRRWAYSLIRKAPTPPPSYGSEEWLALPNDSPLKVAGCVVAAEAWAGDGEDLAGRLEREVADAQLAHKHAEDEEYQRRAAEHRRTWKHLSVVGPPRYVGQVVRPLEDIGAEHMAERQNQAGQREVRS